MISVELFAIFAKINSLMKYVICSVAFMMTVIGLNAQVSAIQPGQRGYTPPPMDRPALDRASENTLADLDMKMDIYEEEFQLDAFEKAVLKNSIVKFEEGRMAIINDSDLDYKKRQEAVEKLKPTFYQDVSVFLTEDEINKFIAMHFGEEAMKSEMKKRKKAKKKKKKNKKN